jgi:hypothetical protein
MERQMRRILRWLLLCIFSAYGVYLMVWAIQSASFYVQSQGLQEVIFRERAIILFPVAIALISQGILFFLVLSLRKT